MVHSPSISSFMHFSPVPLSPSASPSCSSFSIVQPWSLTNVPGAPLPPSPSGLLIANSTGEGRSVLPSAHLDDLQPIAIDPRRHIHQSLGSPTLALRIRRVFISGTRSNHFTVQLTLSPTPFCGSLPPGPRVPFSPSSRRAFSTPAALRGTSLRPCPPRFADYLTVRSISAW